MSANSPYSRSFYPQKPISFGCSFVSGFAFKSKNFLDVGCPVVKIKNIQNGKVTTVGSQCVSESLITEKMSKFRLSKGDVLIAMTGQGSVGRVGRLTFDDSSKVPVLNQRVGKFVADEENLNLDFLYYLISSRAYEDYFFAAGSGSGQPNLSPSTILSVHIPYPPYKEQCEIGGILKVLDDKIELNRQINQTLEQMAQAIFKSWFIDFEPVHVKVQAIKGGRDPIEAAAKVIGNPSLEQTGASLREIAALFPSEFEESELWLVPKGWGNVPLDNVCQFSAGSAFKKHCQGQDAGDYPFIKVSDMNLAGNEVFICSANNYVTEQQRKEMKSKLHPVGAIVFAKIGVALQSNRRRLLVEPTIIDNNMMSAMPLDGVVSVPFLYLFLMKEDFNVLVKGTALPYLNVSDLKKIQVMLPNDEGRTEIMSAFTAFVKPCIDFLNENARQSNVLIKIRDTLLPKLLSGEIRVGDVEQQIAEVVHA